MITCTLGAKQYSVDFISGRALREMGPAWDMYAKLSAVAADAVAGRAAKQAKDGADQPSVTAALDVLVRWFCLVFGKQFSPDDVYDHYPVDRLIFVKGRLVACGPIGDLGRQLEQSGAYTIELMATPGGDPLTRLIQGVEGVEEIEREHDMLLVRASQDVRFPLMKALVEAGFRPDHLRQRGSDLDEIYRRYFEKEGEHRGSDPVGQNVKGLFGRKVRA